MRLSHREDAQTSLVLSTFKKKSEILSTMLNYTCGCYGENKINKKQSILSLVYSVENEGQ